jgi:hypothetical protein
MSVQQADLARAWGISRSRVTQLKNEGMPLTSLEEAQAWRIARFGSSAKNGRTGSTGKILPAETEGGVLPERPEPVSESDLNREDIFGTLARLKKNELYAWAKLVQAVKEKNELEIAVQRRNYKDAVGLRIAHEKAVDEILVKRGELVTLAEAKELFGQFLAGLRLTLKTLPVRLSARCNPSDPELAKQTLHEAVERIFKTLNEWEC